MVIRSNSVRLFVIAFSLIFLASFFASCAAVVSADSYSLDTKQENRLAFEHLMYVSNPSTSPLEIVPGERASLSFAIENKGTQLVKDVRVQVSLPGEIVPYQDILTRKFSTIIPGQKEPLVFSIMPSPNIAEGVYTAGIMVDYVNLVGDERQDNETISLIVGSMPSVIIKVDKNPFSVSGGDAGIVGLKFFNNGLANMKFLTVKLENSPDYEILGDNIDYIGNLDSDDSDNVDFNLQIVNADKKEIDLPLTLTYKDVMNKPYTQTIDVKLKISSEKKSWFIFYFSLIAVVIVLLIVYVVYRRKKSGGALY